MVRTAVYSLGSPPAGRTVTTTVKPTILLRDAETHLGDDERTALSFRALPVIMVVDLDGAIIFEADAEATCRLEASIVDVARRRLAPHVVHLINDVVHAPAPPRAVPIA